MRFRRWQWMSLPERESVAVSMSGALNVSVCDGKKHPVWLKLPFADLETMRARFRVKRPRQKRPGLKRPGREIGPRQRARSPGHVGPRGGRRCPPHLAADAAVDR
ncbi:hypothetical protein BVI2075_130022 [Burkholderia vietnamiensis]|nr:hypothetical protein BVI2075_130022 [Burkholderia vietnamiensis]CAG9231101.1 hypothetical protein BVI1335_760005 [Burkholderia vietnamiensis]